MINHLTDAAPMNGETDQIDTVEAEPFRPYHLRLIGNRNIRADATIEGVVENTTSETWGPLHSVGLRSFRDSSGKLIANFELRAKLSPNPLEPGRQALFRFDLKTLGLPANAASFIMDVVEDGVSWFVERGALPIEFNVETRNDHLLNGWLIWLASLREDAAPEAAAKIAVLEEGLMRSPVRSHPVARRLAELLDDCQAGRAYRPVRAHSQAIAEAIEGSRASEPRAAFLRHFAIAIGRTIQMDDAEGQASIFARFVRESHQQLGVGNAPLPQAMCDWLSRRALPRGIATTPATRSMLATIPRDELIDLNPSDQGADQFWRFAKRVAIEYNIASAAIPDVALRAMVRPLTDQDSPSSFPAATFFMRWWAEQSGSGLPSANLDTDSDRLLLVIQLYLLGLENEALRYFLGHDLRAWMEDPLDSHFDVSALEIMLLALAGRAAPSIGNAINDLVDLRREVSWLSPTRAPATSPTLRLLGLLRSPSGLGTNMRMSERVFASIGMPLDLVDTQANRVIPAPRAISGPIRLSRPVDLFHLNLDEVPGLICRYTQRDRCDTYRICFALWETSAMPEQHRIGLELVDEIWAPTRYVADVYRAAGHPNVHVIGKGIELPDVLPFDLTRLGVPQGLTTFLVAFDMGSWVDRKNPIAAVKAFQKAFTRDPDVRLIIKSNGLYDHPGDRTGQVERIEAAAQNDHRIVIISDLLPFAEYLGLIQAVSATVSPHRAEGFGYLPAYSLLLGRPTIVTDHSGPMDFCSEETSFPVRATLPTLMPGEFVYEAANAHWADIDVAHLAERMRQVREDPKGADARARRGRDLVRSRYSIAAMAERYRDRLSAIYGV